MAGFQENFVLEIILIQNGGYSQKFSFRNYSNPKWRVSEFMSALLSTAELKKSFSKQQKNWSPKFRFEIFHNIQELLIH